MAEVENNEKCGSSNINVCFSHWWSYSPALKQAVAEEVQAQGVAKPYPFPFCLWSPLVAFLKITTKFKDHNYRCLLFCCKSQNETH